MKNNLFKGRTLVIATKHNKETVIAPLFEKDLQVRCMVPEDFDTDVFGTFSGEVERKNDPYFTAKQKCLSAMELTGRDLGIASEGSFGPHPSLFFIPADEEVLFFIDKKNKIEIVVSEISTETNFQQKAIEKEEELIKFAEQANFPSHGLILKKEVNNSVSIIKGIELWDDLLRIFNEWKPRHPIITVETDMRARFNPTRMTVIESAAKKLLNKINSCCPVCEFPGFGITVTKNGLPCEYCNYPTRSILSYIFQCKNCCFIKEEKYPNGKQKEEQMYCDICNP